VLIEFVELMLASKTQYKEVFKQISNIL
jgi:hypothetical protein